MAQICFDSSVFYTVMVVGFGVIFYVIHQIYQDKLAQAMQSNSNVTVADDQAPLEDPTRHLAEMQQSAFLTSHAQKQEDMQRMMHPLAPPLRRGDFSYSGALPHVPVSIPTRGEYGGFQQSGYLFNVNTPDQAMPLMGRRIHSNQYEYYTFHHNNPQIKIPIKIVGSKEISDGDTIPVSGYNNTFSAKIYELDSPRYIPY